MIMERCDSKNLEDVHVSHGPPFMGSYETVGKTHTHGESRARGSYKDIHVEVDPVVHPRYMMMQENTRACMGIHGNTVMSGSPQWHAEVYNGIQGDALECREETYLVEHGYFRGEWSSPLQ
jgi:hypothetical protein